MATAEELGGRRTPSTPEPKGDKTVTFVGADGNELEVLSSITKGALRVLKKQGYVKQSEHLRKQEDAAERKASGAKDDDDDDDGDEPRKAPAKKAAPRSS
jgi:hypothetical protein